MSDDKIFHIPASTRPAPPPLRIHHLMACAAVVGIQIVLWRSSNPPDAIKQIPAWGMAVTAVSQSLAAVGLTFGALSIYWHLKGYAALVQPGQWLLVARLAFLVQMLLGPFVIAHLRTNAAVRGFQFSLEQVLYVVMVVVSLAVPVVFYGWCAWRVAGTWPWRTYFVFSALGGLVERFWPMIFFRSGWSVVQAMVASYVAGSVIMLSVLAWAVTTDYRRGMQLYWTHWLGVGLAIIWNALGLASGVVYLLGGR